MVSRFVVLSVLVVLASGCYRYVPAGEAPVLPGTHVRVHLSGEGSRRMEEVLGSERRFLSGALEGWGDEVVVSVPIRAEGPVGPRELRHRVILEPGEVVEMDVRELDRRRTMALTGAIAVGVTVAVIRVFLGLGGGGEDFDPTDPNGEGSRVPIPLPLFR